MSREESRTAQHQSARLYADVIVPRHIAKSFTYLVPAPLAPTIAIGQRVLIPFGRTTLEGAVVALNRQLPAGVQAGHLKEIRSLADPKSDLPPALFELSRHVADEYLAPWGQCLRLILPPSPAATEPSARYVATAEGKTALKTETCPEPLRPLLKRIARRSVGILASTIIEGSQASKVRQAMKQLEAKGWITVHKQIPTPRSIAQKEESALPSQAPSTPSVPAPDPSWIKTLDDALQAATPSRILVHAPWGNRLGMLIHVVSQAHTQGKSVLLVAGEVARVEWLGRMITGATKLPVALLHSDLDETTRSERWHQIRDNKTAIVVGTRSAVFVPLPSIGLIWIDGEDDPALKEPQEPRYHARDVAWIRAQTERAVLVLGSSHPSLESLTATGTETLRALDGPSRRPIIEVIDLRREPSSTPFSAQLLAAMRETIARKDRVLLFLNRKGFAGALVCRDCGGVPRCPSCAVAMSYSRQASRLTCRYCGTSDGLPETCATCGSARFQPVGEGTERVEAEAKRVFPDARILRLDGDTLRWTASARRLWSSTESGEWDILIGTQVLFQQAPLPPVGLCGIVQADSSLNVPDFRAAERTYQLLGEAIGFARPAASGGRAILQTMLPTHHLIESLRAGDPSRFYDEELAARRLLGYPPALHLISLSTSGTDASAVEQTARQLATSLAAAHDRITVLGPVPASVGRPRGQQRRQILVKGQDRAILLQTVRTAITRVEETARMKRVKVVVDVDPIDMS